MNRIRELRVKAGLSQVRLYFKSGVNWGSISLIERGLLVPSEKQKKHLARALKVGVGELFPVADSETTEVK
jgi:transcriptional regulator with XRE-family HTH domain